MSTEAQEDHVKTMRDFLDEVTDREICNSCPYAEDYEARQAPDGTDGECDLCRDFIDLKTLLKEAGYAHWETVTGCPCLLMSCMNKEEMYAVDLVIMAIRNWDAGMHPWQEQ